MENLRSGPSCSESAIRSREKRGTSLFHSIHRRAKGSIMKLVSVVSILCLCVHLTSTIPWFRSRANHLGSRANHSGNALQTTPHRTLNPHGRHASPVSRQRRFSARVHQSLAPLRRQQNRRNTVDHQWRPFVHGNRSRIVHRGYYSAVSRSPPLSNKAVRQGELSDRQRMINEYYRQNRWGGGFNQHQGEAQSDSRSWPRLPKSQNARLT